MVLKIFPLIAETVAIALMLYIVGNEEHFSGVVWTHGKRMKVSGDVRKGI